MALNTLNVGYSGGPTLAAPTVSETIPDPGPGVFLLVVVGATATTITLQTPGNLPTGPAVPDTVLGPVSNTTLLVRVDGNYRDPATNNAVVTFSQVASVTASIIRT
jgi:hypothetical protein